MDYWAAAGSIILGIVVMYVALMFIRREVEKDSTAKALGAFLTAILAGTAVQFLTSRIGANEAKFAQYAIGLGLLLYLIVGYMTTGQIMYGEVRTLDEDRNVVTPDSPPGAVDAMLSEVMKVERESLDREESDK